MFLIVLAYIINLMTVVNKFAPLKPRKFWQLPKQLFFNHETSDWYQWEKRGLFGFSINGGRKKQRIKEIEKERKKEKRKERKKEKDWHSQFYFYFVSYLKSRLTIFLWSFLFWSILGKWRLSIVTRKGQRKG